jgi:ABC-type lipoprotein export system ATPase subunit
LSHLTTELGLTPFIHRPIQRLSQGEKQRVAIARALCLKPGLILADEPTGNLDPSNKIRVRDLLQQEALNLNATLVMVTHDRELVTPFDQVIDFETFQTRQPQTAQAS